VGGLAHGKVKVTMLTEELYIPDTSVFIRGTLRKEIEKNSLEGRLVIHSLIVAYFEYLAKNGVSEGVTGLQEVKSVKSLAESAGIDVEFTRDLPSGYRTFPPIDNPPDQLLRDLALEWNAVLMTSDRIAKEAAEAMGVRVSFLEPSTNNGLRLEEFFTDDTMSIHLKENVRPFAKRGVPGKWYFVPLREEVVTRQELEDLMREIIEKAKTSPHGFIEIDRPGSTIAQLDNLRIVITKPPFSDGIEITAVRPIVKLRLEDYNLPDKLIERLEKKAEGILIAGAPGMGKTTFAQALAEYYHSKGKIVKTIESPRDMQLPQEITQYSKNYASSEEIHDVLLLSRPDYTFFDEMRDTRDFELYKDLRLAGVGMVGVVHATSPIDAIQRFIGRVELGMIPSIIDTVIFIKYGRVAKVYELETTVKIPHGLKEAELARPVVVVRDFLTSEPEYELYVFGERTFVVPVKKRRSARDFRVKLSVERLLRRYIPDENMEIVVMEEGHVMVLVDTEYYNYLLGKPKKKLERLGKRLGIQIEVRPRF